MTRDPLRIGITCYPTFGGSGIVATEVGQSLASRGHRVHFICYDVPTRLDRFADNIVFHQVQVRSYPLFDHQPYALALASKMVEVAEYEGLDLLHVHYAVPHATSAYLARQILGARAPRIVTTLHGTDITLVGRDASYLPITRFSIVESDAVTAPSDALVQATREQLEVPASTPIEVIPNFVDTARFRPDAAQRGRCLGHLFGDAAAGNAPPALLVHVSNFRAIKRVDDAVRVLARVRERRPACLALVGDGPERSAVQSLVRQLGLQGSVRLLGKREDFVELLQGADVFLMPSENESFGLAALEAQACGVPVVASRVGGVPEVIADGETGLLCPMGDVDAMAAAALALLDAPERWRAMSAAARARVLARYERERQIDRYEACYRRVLAAPRR